MCIRRSYSADCLNVFKFVCFVFLFYFVMQLTDQLLQLRPSVCMVPGNQHPLPIIIIILSVS